MDPFISEQDLSDYLGRDLSDDDGAVIAVDAACDIVRTLSEQDFSPLTETATLDGSGTDVLLLPQVPVSAVSEVVVNGGTLDPDTDYVAEASGQLFRTQGTAAWNTWAQTGSPWPYWPQGRQNITVTYDHGYSEDDLPRDVRMVALMIASRLAAQGVAAEEQVGQARIKYAVAATDLTAGEQAILRKYRQAQ